MGWSQWQGDGSYRQHVTEKDAERSEAYLCGGRPMVDDVKVLLMDKGMGANHIHHENFF